MCHGRSFFQQVLPTGYAFALLPHLLLTSPYPDPSSASMTLSLDASGPSVCPQNIESGCDQNWILYFLSARNFLYRSVAAFVERAILPVGGTEPAPDATVLSPPTTEAKYSCLWRHSSQRHTFRIDIRMCMKVNCR